MTVRHLAAPRSRKLVTGILASFGAMGAGSVAAIIVAPVMFHHLGAELFGLWVAVTALTSVALFADLGMGNSLLTRLSTLRPGPSGQSGPSGLPGPPGAGDPEKSGGSYEPDAARMIAVAYLSVAGIAALLLATVVTISVVMPVGTLFGVTDAQTAAKVPGVLMLCFGALAVNLPLSLITKIQVAVQDTAYGAAWAAATATWTVTAVGGAAAAGMPPLALIALAASSAPIGHLVNSLHYFTRVRPDLRPRPWILAPDLAGGLVRLSVRYLALSVLTSTAASIDGYLVARWLGPIAAAHYGVAVRMLVLLNLLVTVVSTPLWPANAQALAAGDLQWVRRTTRRMCMLSAGLVGAAAAVLVAASSPLLAAWIRSPDFHGLPAGLVALLATWPVLLATTAPMFMVQNSAGRLGPQFAGWGAYLLLSLPSKAMLVPHLGLAGIPLVNAVAFVVTVLPACVSGYRSVVTGHRPRHAVGASRSPACIPAMTGPRRSAKGRTCS